MSAMPAFQMAIAQPKWFEKKFSKIPRSFLWAGKMETSGGHCLVRWDTVCRPLFMVD
jgi:hypothetical protein